MKQNNPAATGKRLSAFLFSIMLLLASATMRAQISSVCTDPQNIIYGLTGSGEIREINVNTAATGTVIKNTTYSGSSPSSANGLGYNYLDGKFYYFKRNVTSSSQEFVSFNPSTNTVTILAPSTCTDDVHTGCVSSSGTGYYTVDVDGNLSYYNIVTNTWTFITSTIVDQYGNDVDAVIRSQSAGDMAIDGWGNIWLVTANSSNYGLYRFPASLPTSPVASFTVTQIIAPTATTPTGQSFAGIAFSPSGQIYMATKSGNRLYRMESNLSLTYIGAMTTSDIGNDLTSCSFPLRVLPIMWRSFDAVLKSNNTVLLTWEVTEETNKGFYVQFSTDGARWENLTFIESKNLPETITRYSFTHFSKLSGKHYYRIRGVGRDDDESYSTVKTISIKNEKQAISLWPNPAKNQVNIINDGSSGTVFVQAQIFDLSGKQLSEIRMSPGENTININSLRAGTYLIRLKAENGLSVNEKIIKQ